MVAPWNEPKYIRDHPELGREGAKLAAETSRTGRAALRQFNRDLIRINRKYLRMREADHRRRAKERAKVEARNAEQRRIREQERAKHQLAGGFVVAIAEILLSLVVAIRDRIPQPVKNLAWALVGRVARPAAPLYRTLSLAVSELIRTVVRMVLIATGIVIGILLVIIAVGMITQ